MVHRGDACSDNKTLLFFHARPNADVEEDLQFHAGLLGSLIYGHIPPSINDKNEYYGMIRKHNESIKKAKVPLTELLEEKVRICYEKWLGKQTYTLEM